MITRLMHRAYVALPEPVIVILDRILHPFRIYGWSCRGRQEHEHQNGRWI